MLTVRSTLASLVAPALAAAPYLIFFPDSGGLVPAVALLVALLATIFLVLARLGWRTKSMVVREHLYGWPIGIAFLFFLPLAIPSWVAGGLGLFVALLAATAASAAVGVGAMAIWLRLSYPNQETG